MGIGLCLSTRRWIGIRPLTMSARRSRDFERRGAQTEGARPREETEHREGRIELEPPCGKVEPAGRAMMVVSRRVRRRVVPVAVTVTAPVDDCPVDWAHHPVHPQEQKMPPSRGELDIDESIS